MNRRDFLFALPFIVAGARAAVAAPAAPQPVSYRGGYICDATDFARQRTLVEPLTPRSMDELILRAQENAILRPMEDAYGVTMQRMSDAEMAKFLGYKSLVRL